MTQRPFNSKCIASEELQVENDAKLKGFGRMMRSLWKKNGEKVETHSTPQSHEPRWQTYPKHPRRAGKLRGRYCLTCGMCQVGISSERPYVIYDWQEVTRDELATVLDVWEGQVEEFCQTLHEKMQNPKRQAELEQSRREVSFRIWFHSCGIIPGPLSRTADTASSTPNEEKLV